ncbi:AraC family transcriptional regulator [Cupriavidus sp. UGS-1]|uniref:AraC family transcriptional regulator n=1 Tax=Cupriavidus sp. UGS-1 TaxID=2899826 RepID=UPI001E4111C3|nr:AraC family transcriptional regulator [Cupriavidus sp. UGS-1]MCD9119576.1 AraC family transcriptional regulator [Cupriavidus sp. UGS-1]
MNTPPAATFGLAARRVPPPPTARAASSLLEPGVARHVMDNGVPGRGAPLSPGARVQARRGASWLMPVTVWESSVDGEAAPVPPPVDGHILEWHLSASTVQRVLPSGHIIETLPPNGFLLRPMGLSLRVKTAGPTCYVHFHLADSFLRTVAVDWLGDAADCDGLLCCGQLMRSDAQLVSMLDVYLRRALDPDEAPTRLEMDSRAHLIALQVLRRHSTLVEGQLRARRGGLAPHQLKKACELMTRDLAEDIPLSVLAGEIGVSYHHFCHAFKMSTGQPPRQWLVERRVEAACELLRTTRMTVTEIAAAVGYDDQNQLLRVFRSRRGTTPGAYRREFQDVAGTAAVAMTVAA